MEICEIGPHGKRSELQVCLWSAEVTMLGCTKALNFQCTVSNDGGWCCLDQKCLTSVIFDILQQITQQ